MACSFDSPFLQSLKGASKPLSTGDAYQNSSVECVKDTFERSNKLLFENGIDFERDATLDTSTLVIHQKYFDLDDLSSISSDEESFSEKEDEGDDIKKLRDFLEKSPVFNPEKEEEIGLADLAFNFEP